jgi:membrane associated rhomboid family serine protease
MSDQPVGPVSHCYRHPNREALVRCTRCDRPICPDCMREASVGFHCPEDVALARKTVRAPRTSVGAVLRNSPPYVTSTLIALNIAIYAITGSQSHDFGSPQAASSKLFYDWQLFPAYIKQHDAYYQLITSAFLHLNLLHIGSNMIALAVIGPPLERLLGPSRFTAVYFISALGGGAAVYIFGAAGGTTVGASGAIFGLFAACLIMVRRLGLNPQWLIGIIVLNFVFTFSVPDISHEGHVGGFIVGGIAAVAIGGIPRAGRAARRITTNQQAMGLIALTAVIVIAVVLRSATGHFPSVISPGGGI